MPRNMAVSLTEGQVRARTKDVTRRTGWVTLKAGQWLQLVRKGMGLKKGETVVRIALVKVVSVTFERLDTITADECRREGFPEMTPAEFVEFFCSTHRGVKPDTIVTRIEWIYFGQAPGSPPPGSVEP